MANHYTCLLCDVDIVLKKTKGKVDTMELAKNHLKSSQHKLKYLVRISVAKNLKKSVIIRPESKD